MRPLDQIFPHLSGEQTSEFTDLVVHASNMAVLASKDVAELLEDPAMRAVLHLEVTAALFLSAVADFSIAAQQEGTHLPLDGIRDAAMQALNGRVTNVLRRFSLDRKKGRARHGPTFG